MSDNDKRREARRVFESLLNMVFLFNRRFREPGGLVKMLSKKSREALKHLTSDDAANYRGPYT